MKINEKQYKRIADEYLREYGAQLRAELEDMEQDRVVRVTPSLDRRVKRGVAALKRPRYLRYAGLVAACLAIALLTPVFIRMYTGQPDAQSPGIYAPPATDSAGTSSPSPGTSSPSPGTSSPSPGTSSPSPTAPPPSTPAPPSETYKIIPLSFTLPVQFTVDAVDLDINKTIYHLRDSKRDDVVITLERSGDISRYDDLVEIPLGDSIAFASGGNGYNLLAIMDDEHDILYTLTCRHDINTLVLLGNSIVI